MRFLNTTWLLLLLAVLALIGLYLVLQLRRKAYAARFTNVDLLGRIAPKRPGWRRHIAFALLIGALGTLTLAMAEPASQVKVPRDRATVCMAMDVSLSMEATDIKPNRFEAMKKSAADFVKRLPQGINLGLVSFSGTAAVVQPPTTDRNAIITGVNSLELDQSTATGEGIFTCLQAIANFESTTPSEDAKPAPARIVLLSDGARTVGRPVEAAVAAAKKAKIPVSTIAFGTDGGTVEAEGETIPVPADKAAMEQIAEGTGGTYFSAESAAEIDKVWKDIGSQIGYRMEFRPITERFIGTGLVLAFLAAGSALLWTNRLL